MTIAERVNNLVNNQINFGSEYDPASIEKMIVMAYYMGREAAAKEVSDMYRSHIKAQKDRAGSCRYHNMAASVVGAEDYLYSSDYAGDMTNMFGRDRSDI